MPDMHRKAKKFSGARKLKPTTVIFLLGLSCIWIVLVLSSIQQENEVFTLTSQVAANTEPSSSCYPKTGLRPIIGDRYGIGDLLEEYGMSTGVEVGVKQGAFAKEILQRWKSCKLYKLVDLWAHQENYKDVANVKNEEHNRFFEETKQNLKPYEHIVEYYRMYSVEAARKIELESIDFIYIDARHDYCGVMEDLEAYWPLLKPGGIMAGDDFASNDEVRGQDWGLCQNGTRIDSAVKGAVLDFFLPKGLTVSVTHEKRLKNWFLQKPLC